MTLPALLRRLADTLEQSTSMPVDFAAEVVPMLQCVITEASEYKAALSRKLPGYLPLIGHRTEKM